MGPAPIDKAFGWSRGSPWWTRPVAAAVDETPGPWAYCHQEGTGRTVRPSPVGLEEVHGRDGHLGGWGGTPHRSSPAAAYWGTSLVVMDMADTLSVAVVAVAVAVLDGSCGQVEASELAASGERGHSYRGQGSFRFGRGRGCLRPQPLRMRPSPLRRLLRPSWMEVVFERSRRPDSQGRRGRDYWGRPYLRCSPGRPAGRRARSLSWSQR